MHEGVTPMAKAELLVVGSHSGCTILSNPGGIGRWLKAGTAFSGEHVQAVWAHPEDPTVLLCSTTSHLWQSHDGGQQWQEVPAPPMTTLIASRTTPDRVVGGNGEALFVSHDAGKTWHMQMSAHTVTGGAECYWALHTSGAQWSNDGGQRWQPLPPPTPHQVVVSSTGQAVMYALDGGWSHCASQPTATAPLQTAAYLAGAHPTLLAQYGAELWHHCDTWNVVASAPIAILLHPTMYHPDRVWAGTATGELWLSNDRGLHWECIRANMGHIVACASARLM
jgi:photosystem II stability/assembly factor-like uncharacterized protein